MPTLESSARALSRNGWVHSTNSSLSIQAPFLSLLGEVNPLAAGRLVPGTRAPDLATWMRDIPDVARCGIGYREQPG